MNAMIPAYVYTTNFIADRVETIKEHHKNDRGAGFVEYAGLIVLAALILGALYKAGLVSKLTDKVGQAVDQIFSGKGNQG